MPVPSAITDLSVIPGSNYPSGTESPATLDDYLRTHAAFIAQNYATAQAGYADREMPGVVKHFAGAAAPTGWLACSGQAVSRATYAALFAAIGTTWGVGDGSTTFNLPPAGRMLIGAGVAYAVGATGGSADAVAVAHTHTGTTGVESANHTHSGTTSTSGAHTHGVLGGTASGGNVGTLLTANNNAGVTSTTASGGDHSHTITTGNTSASHTHGFTTASAGVSGTNANLPPYAAMLLIIKT